MKENILKEGCSGRVFNADKMYVYLRGVLDGANMAESRRALMYMRKRHAGQWRNDGQPYEIHPLMMACYAVSLDDALITDSVLATILLHDVCEETSAMVEELPFSEAVRRGVKYVTLTRFSNETKYEQKKRYMNELLESLEATITKAIDRYMNLMTMPGTFSEEKMRKNVVETDLLLLPVLKQAKYKWPMAAKLLYALRTNIRSVNDVLAMLLGVQLTDAKFVNALQARDYAFLVTGGECPWSGDTES